MAASSRPQQHPQAEGAPEQVHLLTVDVAGAGLRLDVWLARQLHEHSRAYLQTLIHSSRVLLNHRRTRASVRLQAGQTIEVAIPPPVPDRPEPEDIPLRVIHQDAHLLVLDKPAGLVVHPGAGRHSGTLVNALLFHVQDLSGIGGVQRPGIIHRLDRDTTGLLVVAKDDETHRGLARQFADREVVKEYLAIVHGVPRPPRGEIQTAIGRDPRHRHRMAARAPRGRAARSAYEVLERLDGAALVRVRIYTGRTHQVRVHLASIGHPLAGDPTYGGSRTGTCRLAKARQALERFPRPALHAARLSFVHPRTGEHLAFESPLPADLTELLESLRAPR